MKTLAERLRWARGATGLSARKLSERAGLKSRSHVALIESGEKGSDGELSVATVTALAAALGVSLEWLANGAGETPSAEAIAAHVKASPDESADDLPAVHPTGTGEG